MAKHKPSRRFLTGYQTPNQFLVWDEENGRCHLMTASKARQAAKKWEDSITYELVPVKLK